MKGKEKNINLTLHALPFMLEKGGEYLMAAKSQSWTVVLEEWFGKLPPLPKSAQQAIVNITPWLALVFGILGVLASLAGLGIVGVFSPLIALGGGFGAASGSLLGMLLALVGSALLLAAFPGTKARKLQGWNLLFWSEVVSVVSSLASFSLSGVVFALIAFYLLYQIKPYYK